MIRDTIGRDQWFDMIGYLKIHHHQASEKGYKQTVDSDTNVSVSSEKTSDWRGLRISLHGSKKVKKYRSYLR